MTDSSELASGEVSLRRAIRLQIYCRIRLASLTALQIIQHHVLPTGAGRKLTRAQPVETDSGDRQIQHADIVGDDEDFLSHLASLHKTIWASSTDLALPTTGAVLWSDLLQAVRSGGRAREPAIALCQWIEEYYNVNSEEDLHLNPDTKFLMVGKNIYDASGCFFPCMIIAYYYKHRYRVVGPKEVWTRVLGGRGSVDRVKDLFESLPDELRGFVKSVPGVGRMWCG